MSIRRHFRDGLFYRTTRRRGPRGTLLYIHGLGESGLCFESLLSHPRLASWTQIVVDLPGYGKSEWAPQPLTLREQAECIARVSRRESRWPIVLVGHSMGGVIGQIVCELDRCDFLGFVNVEGNLTLDDCSFSRPAAAYSSAEFLTGGFMELADQTYLAGVQEAAQRGYYASLRFCDPRAFHLNSRELVKLSTRGDLADRLASLNIPTLYLAGLRNRTGDASLQALRSSGVRREEWEDAGHWPFIDHPDRFVVTLDGFLTSLQSS